ncbi:MAG: hypothetical protein ACEQR4_02310 [Rhodoluna sp.]
MAYYTYSRYLMDSGVNSTPYGIVQKTNDYSQPTSEKTIARKISQAQSGAKAYWERVQQYILDNQTKTFLNLYPNTILIFISMLIIHFNDQFK